MLKRDTIEDKTEYVELKVGEKLIKGDEYSSDIGRWIPIPDFLAGDIIPESHTKWRRIVLKEVVVKPKKKWYNFFS